MTGQPTSRWIPQVQLWGAIEAVWKSWTLKKAVDYRQRERISETLGTGVNVVAMVFGNIGDDSGTGVAFTRDPSTGERKFYGEFLVNAQGEDVVAGIRTPLRHRGDGEAAARRVRGAAARRRTASSATSATCRTSSSRSSAASCTCCRRAPASAPRRPRCASRATWSTKGSSTARSGAAASIADQLDQLLHPVIDPQRARDAAVRPACPRARVPPRGRAVFDPDVAEQRAASGEAVILVREETTPEDFHGIVAARAVLTARGGMTSHAAVVARGMGKCAIVGCKDIHVDVEQRTFSVERHDGVAKATGSRSMARRAASSSATSRRCRAKSSA